MSIYAFLSPIVLLSSQIIGHLVALHNTALWPSHKLHPLRAHYKHTYVCLPCIYLFTFFVLCFVKKKKKKLSLDQVIMNIFGLRYNEIESQV